MGGFLKLTELNNAVSKNNFPSFRLVSRFFDSVEYGYFCRPQS
jgi:hypothetical protein